MKRSFFSWFLLFSFVIIFTNVTAQTVVYKATNGTHNYEVCNGFFADSGDTTAVYSGNEIDTITFYPSTVGAKIEIEFLSFATEADFDFLEVYDGTSALGTYIGTYHGDYSPGKITAAGTTGAITFVFTSDQENNFDGWKATIKCVGTSLSCASIISPANKATGISTNPGFEWESVPGATSYDVTIATARVVIAADNIVGTSYNFSLSEGVTYYWRVVPRNGTDTAAFCPIYSFTTQSALTCPTLTSPQNEATGVSMYPFFQWSQVTEADHYSVTYSTAMKIIKNTVTTFTNWEGEKVDPGTTYYWTVFPIRGTDTLKTCTPASFTTLSAPSCPTGLSPENAATGVAASGTITWNTVSNASGYYFYLSTSLPLRDSMYVYTNSYSYSLLSNTKYYWKVIPYNGAGAATGCETREFTTASQLTLIYPNGGQTYKAGDTMNIRLSSAITGYIYFYLSNDGGVTWPGENYYFASDYMSSTGNQLFNVSLPADLQSSGEYKLKVYSASYQVFDISDGVFTINGLPPSFAITTPTSQTFWKSNSSQYIYWTTVNAAGTSYLYYSLNGGSDWISIGSRTSTNSQENYYYWTIPSVTGNYDNCKILVTNSDSSVTATSQTFTISDISQYAVVVPTRKDTLRCSQYHPITFQNKGSSGLVYLYYSLDGGTNWNYFYGFSTQAGLNEYSWYVPSISYVAENCLINVYDYYSGLNAYSDTFMIAPAPGITINYPSGNYLVWNTSYPIRFNSKLVNKVNIEYSSNSGSTYSPIESNVTVINGENVYNWVAPEGSGTNNNYYLKISDAANSSVYSSTYFYMKDKAVVLNSPVGGESVDAGDTLAINYTTRENYIYVYFFLSYDGGKKWTYLTYNYQYSAGTYTYNYILPFDTSSNCLVKISNYNDNDLAYLDYSAEPFRINPAPPSIRVTTPNSYTFWQTKKEKYIYWASYSISGVNLYYSINNGETWGSIDKGITSTNSTQNYYLWTIPGSITGLNTQSLIKVESLDGSVSDISDVFTLSDQSPVVVTFPAKGTKWNAGNTYNIEGNNRGSDTYYDNYIYLSTDGGTTWSSYIKNWYSFGRGTASFNWTVPLETNGSKKCLLRVKDYNSNYITYSDTFEIVGAPPQIKVTYPTAGLYLKTGSKSEIDWTSISVSKVNIKISTDAGNNWTSILRNLASSNGSNYLPLTVPPISGGTSKNCIVRVEDTVDSLSLYGNSGTFTISDKDLIEIRNPIAATNVTAGNDLVIRYTNNGTSLSKTIYPYYSTNGGSSWSRISSFYGLPSGDGSYTWTVPSSLTTNSTMKVAIADNYPGETTVCGISEAFTVTGLPASVTVIEPVAGSYFTSNTFRYITWTSIHATYVTLQYKIGTGNWNDIAVQVNSYDNQTNSYRWTVPGNGQVNDSCWVRVIEYNGTSFSNTSDMFTISNRSPLLITSPNGGETLQAGTSTTIAYMNRGTTFSYAELYYTINNVSRTYITTIYNIPNGSSSYVWNIPNSVGSSNKYRIFIYENTYSTSDTSDNFLTINGATPSISVTSPVAGAILWSGNEFKISYNVVNVATVDIEYSIDGGETYGNSIATNVSTGSSSYWVVPQITGTNANCVIRIKSSGGGSVVGLSGIFTIKNEITNYTLTKPNGGDIVQAGNTYSIEFTNSGKASYADLYYTPNAGIDWNSITSISTNYGSNSYNWSVPLTQATTKKAKVKIVDEYNSEILDTSDRVFTIQKATPYITVSAPEKGSWWTAGNQYSVSWNCLNVKEAVIEYSVDAGTTWKSLDTVNSVYGDNSVKVTAPVVTAATNYGLIKVRDLYVNTVYGTSNSITLSNDIPALTITSPNGGETFTAGSYMRIAYNNNGPTTSAILRISYNGGSSWSYINDYFYAYQGGGTATYYIQYYTQTSTNVLVRIESFSGTHLADQSDAVFTINEIKPFITVTSPSAGNTIWSGDSYTVQWNSAHVDYVDIYYSTNNKNSWLLTQGSIQSSNGTSSCSLTAPVITGKSDSSFIKVVNRDADTTVGISSMFTINNEPAKITVTSPNGGEEYKAGTTMYIYYSYYGRIRDYNKIYLSTDGGKTRNEIVKDYGVSTGSNYTYYEIPVESKSYKNCKIYVEEGYWDNPSIDSSNAVFTIKEIPPSIIVSKPYEADYVVSGNVYSVNWNSFKVKSVDIEYSIDGAVTWEKTKIATNVSSVNGYNSYNYVAPAVSGTFNSSYIRVKPSYASTVKGISSYFTLTNVPIAVTVVKPNGGEKLQAGKSYSISYSNTGPSDNSSIYFYLSTDGGSTYGYVGNEWNNYSTTGGEWTWNIDEYTNSKYCKVKVEKYVVDKYISDVSDSTFEIAPAPAQIEVSSPVAASVWIKGYTESITWNSISTNKVNIQYSTDNGESYNNLAVDVASTNGYNLFTVEVPDTVVKTEVNCRVRVISATDGNVYGISDAFTTTPTPITLTVVNPNGGEVLKTGSTCFIGLNYVGPPLASAALYSSSDGGYNWNNIGSIYNVTEGKQSFEWYIESGATTSQYYKIQAYASSGSYSYSDVSDNFFSVVSGKPELSLSLPNNYSYLVSGNSFNINWTAKNVESVTIEYTVNAGETWNTIASGVTISGESNSYNWTVPIMAGTYDNARIRITSTTDSKVFALSESFIISDAQRSLTLITPNGGNVLYAGKYFTARFRNDGPPTSVSFTLNDGNVTSYYLGTNYNVVNGINSFELYISPAVYGSEIASLSIRDNNYSSSNDASDSMFTVIGINPIISVIKPDSDAYWTAGDIRELQWKSYNVDTVSIAYSSNDGTSWNAIADKVAVGNGNNYYNWAVADVKAVSKKAIIKVTSISDSKVYGQSNSFTLSGTPIELTIVKPNGNDTLKGGKSYAIKYKYTGDDKTVNIYISFDKGSNWNRITSGGTTANLGDNFYYIDVPYDVTISDSCLLRIEDSKGVADTSDDYFVTVAADPTIRVNAPTSGDYCISGTIHAIEWFSWGVTKVNLQYSLNNGSTWTNNIRLRVPSSNDDNKFNWSIPTVSGTFDAKVRVVSFSDNKVLGTSGTFKLTNVPVSYTITLPVKNSSVQAGSVQKVKFSYAGPSTYANIYLSSDSGSTWTLLKESVNVQFGVDSTMVDIPIETPVSSKGLIKIVDMNSVTGTSELFAIKAAAPSLKLLTPVAKAYLLSGNIFSITYETYSVSKVKIEYSLDNKGTWKTIKSNVTVADGSNKYNWKVVPVTSANKQSFIRITSMEDAALVKTSDVITISNKYPSADAKLTEINVAGTLLTGFTTETTNYTYKVPYSTKQVPVVTAKASDANATVSVKSATGLSGTTYIVVTAEDGLSQMTYSVYFSKNEASSNSKLSNIKVNGYNLSGFDPVVYIYNTKSLAVPVIDATPADSNAAVQIKNISSVPGTVVIIVTAEDGFTKSTYNINVEYGVGVNVASEDNIGIYPNPVRDILYVSNAEKATIYIYNFNGQLMMTQNNISKNAALNLSKAAPGIYMLRIVRNDEVINRKVEIIR